MNSIGKSTLLDKTGRLVGFGFTDHPLHPGRKDWFLHIVFYWIEPAQVVICMGDGRGKKRPERMRPQLGQMVPGAAFAPYAQRAIDGLQTMDQLKELATTGWPNIKFEWEENKDGSN